MVAFHPSSHKSVDAHVCEGTTFKTETTVMQLEPTPGVSSSGTDRTSTELYPFDLARERDDYFARLEEVESEEEE